MELDAKFVAELWETIKDFVPANKREELATLMLELMVEHDIEILDLDELHGVDDDLDVAMEAVFEDLDLEEDDH
jgi:hypothetical protein